MAGKRKGFGFSIGLDITDFERSCKNLNKQIDQLLGANIVKMSNMAAGALAGVTASIAAVGAAAYKFGSQMDAMKTALEGTWGSAQKAGEQYQKFQHIVENSNYNMSQLMGLDKTMKALGLNIDDSAKAIQRLVNVGTANPNASLESLADALLQIKTTGTVGARQLKVFADAGIEVSDIMGKDASTAINTLLDRMQKFNGYMEGEATDIWNQIPRAVEIVQDALADLGNYLNDNFKGYIVQIVDRIADLRDKFKLLLTDKAGLQNLKEAFRDFGIAITTVAIPAIVKMTIKTAPLALQIGVLTASVVALAETLRDVFSEDSQLSNVIGNFFEWMYNGAKYWLKQLQLEIQRTAANIASSFGNDDLALKIAYDNEMLSREIKDLSTNIQISYNGMSQAAKKFAENSYTKQAIDNFKELKDSLLSINGEINTGSDASGGSLGKVTANGSGGTSAANSSGKPGDLIGNWLGQTMEQIKPWAEVMGHNTLWWFNESVAKAQKSEPSPWQEYKTNMVATLADGFTEVLFASGNFFQNMGEMLQNLGKQILQQIAQFMILKTLFSAFGIKGVDLGQFSPIAGFMSDGVVQNGKIIGTDPNDTIIAMKHPENLGNNGANVVVNVNNNTSSQVSTNSYFDGEKTVIDLVINALDHNVNGSRDYIRSL